MNSISFLDSVLTRSLSTSRAGSGSTTPALEGSPTSTPRRRDDSVSDSDGVHEGGARLGRRASDYSLSRVREREKRKVASTLGLTALDTAHGPEGPVDEDSRPRRRSSKRGSRRESVHGSGTEGDESDVAGSSHATVESSRTQSRHPKSSSSDVFVDRSRMRRAGSTPAPLTPPHTPRRWGSLWGFGGFLEDARAAHAAIQRPASTNPYDGKSRGARVSRSSTNLAASSPHQAHRRASTGDADAFIMHQVAHHALLSEREREDVVDFEGADPDDDIALPYPQAPPSTPFPAKTVSSTPAHEQSRRASLTSDGVSSVLGTGSKLSSILFGALNPLTDDYFGPQPSKRKSSVGSSSSSNRRGRSHTVDEERSGSANSSASDTSSKDSHRLTVPANADSMSDSARVSLELPALTVKQNGLKAGPQSQGHLKIAALNDADPTSTGPDGLPRDPPPPYSDAQSSSSTTRLVLLDARTNAGEMRQEYMPRKLGRRKRLASVLVRGARNALEMLHRLILIIVLGPYRAYQLIRNAISGKGNEPTVESLTTAQESEASLQGGRRFATASQALRPSAARHQALRRSGSAQEADGSDSEEIITEDQAAARAARQSEKQQATHGEFPPEKALPNLQQALSSRLLPNPNPIDPLLAHDRNAEKRTLQEKSKYEEQQRQLQLTRKSKQAQAASRPAVIHRGPTSMLIHHSPKVLVLDLDETLIHSTSRSPTWSALADKSKSRMAVTAGGSLLGLEGLGGVLGLRGQVGVRPHQVEVVLDGRSLIYHVYKRPHVDTFLRKVAAWYHVIVFTASVQEYADPVIDWLDQGRGLISGRLFREACTFRNGSYLKNLMHVDADLSRVCLVDNSPASYAINQANGIPIEGWTHDPHDEALLDLLPVLDSLRFASDVRHILGVRGFSI